MLSSCSHLVMAVLVFHQGLPSHQLRFHLFLGTCSDFWHVLNLAAESISPNASHSSAVSCAHAAKDKCIEQQLGHM